MKIAVLSIGTELLTGKVINTNTYDIGQFLKKRGYQIDVQIAVHDNYEEIYSALHYIADADFIVATGGLGPTHDDLTEKAFDQYFVGIHKEPIPNHVGKALGVHYEVGKRHVILVPGPPNECMGMMSIFDTLYPPLIKDQIDYKVAGLNEKLVENKLLKHLQPDEFATYVGSGFCTISLEHQNDELIKELFGVNYISCDGSSLEQVTINLLKKLKLSACTVESVTCGKIAEQLTSVSGSSEVFYGNISPYMAQAKTELLGVSEGDIEQYTTVSPEMSAILADKMKPYSVDIVLAVTGYAEHPDEQLHGTIHMCCTTPLGKRQKSLQYNSKQRENNRRRMANGAIQFLRETILHFYETQV